MNGNQHTNTKKEKKWLNGDSKTSNFKTKSEKVENLLGSYNLLEKKMRKSSKEKKTIDTTMISYQNLDHSLEDKGEIKHEL